MRLNFDRGCIVKGDCEGCPYCDYDLRTDPPVALGATGTTALLVRGDGARHAVIVTMNALSTADPETQVWIGLQPDTTGGFLGSVSVNAPVLIMRYSDYGDAIRQPLFATANVAAQGVTGTSVRRVPRGH